MPPVNTPVKVVLRGGTIDRRVIGTEVTSPLPVLSCTDADTSPGWDGSLVLTKTVRVAPAGIRTGLATPALV